MEANVNRHAEEPRKGVTLRERFLTLSVAILAKPVTLFRMTDTAPALTGYRAKTPNQVVATNVRAILSANDVDQAWLADALGQNQMWLSRRLSDSNAATFSTDEVAQVAEILNVPVGDLFIDRRTVAPAAVKLPDLDSNQEPIVFKSQYLGLDQLADHRRAKTAAHQAVARVHGTRTQSRSAG